MCRWLIEPCPCRFLAQLRRKGLYDRPSLRATISNLHACNSFGIILGFRVSVFWLLFLSLRQLERRLAGFMQAAMITAHDRKAEKTTWSSQGSSCIKPGVWREQRRVKCWDAHHTFQPRFTIHLHWHCQTKNKNYPFPSTVSQANPCNVSAPMSQMPQMIWIERFKLDFNPHKILASKEWSFFSNWHTSRQVQQDWNCMGRFCRRDSASSPRLPPFPTWTPNSNIHKACSWREHQQTRGRFSNK